MWPLLFPFIEQPGCYDIFVKNDSTTGRWFHTSYADATSSWWKTKISEEEQKALAGIPLFKCPSRRSGVQMVESETGNNSGPTHDYLIPVLLDNRLRNTEGNTRTQAYDSMTDRDAPCHVGTFRVAITHLNTASQVIAWEGRDTMAWWADGTSNQIMFGEKYIPRERVGMCSDLTSGAGTAAGIVREKADCSYIASNGRGSAAICAYINTPGNNPSFNSAGVPQPRLIPNNLNYGQEGLGNVVVWHNYAFGSIHPAGFNAILGDGAVRSIPSSVNPTLVFRLVWVNDGESVQLPD